MKRQLKKKQYLSATMLSAMLAVSISACSKSAPESSGGATANEPSHIPTLSTTQSNDSKALLPNGDEINLVNYSGKTFFVAEGTFTEGAFSLIQQQIAQMPEAEKRAFLSREVDRLFQKLSKAGAIEIDSVASIGYFRFLLPYHSGEDLFGAVKAQGIKNITIEPVVMDTNSLKNAKAHTPQSEGLELKRDARSDNSSFSGLERIGAVEFVKMAEADIGDGAKVDGSSVRLGITDTGITYNHPTFRSADGKKNRIIYMKDSTGEAASYVNPAAKFEATGIAEDALVINAEVIVTPALPSMPAGDALAKVQNLIVKVTPEQKQLILSSKDVKLGAVFESALQAPSKDETADFNHNGKLDDKLLFLYIPAQNGQPEQVIFDPSGLGDFRKSPALADFNASGATMPVFAERVGFAFSDTKLAKQDGDGTVTVRMINFVGFDPGNHGSHVAGIAAGSKTIANDSDLTLARGVAPAAQILMNRICSNNAGCGGQKAIADLAENGGAEVINMSIGGLSPFNDGYGVQETLINRLVSTKNVMFMISAGNNGPGKQTVGSPSVARLSLSIGASASKELINRQYGWAGLASSAEDPSGQDFMLFFSSRGPTASGGFKPTLSAPGTELSSVQLNAAQGSRGGLDVYWGTSMAAPTATGAYALFLDAIKKYNNAHPERKLPTDVMLLRQVLMESARPFDMNRLDTKTSERTTGQYIWADEGLGMINLPAAWKKLLEVRDGMPKTAVTLDGQPIELDYQVITTGVSPNGNAYDGTEASGKEPKFGSGLYLSASDTSTLKPVYIARKLPEKFASGAQAGDLTRQLLTTSDEFELRTVMFGSDQQWIKAGVREQLGCAESETADLNVIADGVTIKIDDKGKGSLDSNVASPLYVCVDQDKVAKLAPGDHGALIYAYRKAGGKTAPVASFIVPIYMNVPHKTMSGSTAYKVEDKVKSFGVKRNYVNVPKGTSVLRVTLEVPAIKTDENGRALKGESCSGVELMAYEAQNDVLPFASRTDARISNCDRYGKATNTEKARKLVLTRVNPKAGMWDLHVFGQYRYVESQYTLTVDYVTGETDKQAIEGNASALSGSVNWKLLGASMEAVPSVAKSRFELSALTTTTPSQVAKGGVTFVESPLGVLRTYPEGTKQVRITTGGSTGNDIDLTILACSEKATAPSENDCEAIATSGSATDVEKAEFVPVKGKKYAVRVDGYDIKDEGKFTSDETIMLATETGTISISSSGATYTVNHAFAADSSKLLTNPLFTEGKYSAVGQLSIRMADDTVIGAVPVKVTK